jgi:acyl carrier protein
MGEVTDRMTDVFRLVLGDPSLTLSDDTTASDIEGWDSVAHINLMFALESEFGIQFAGNEFARFTDVGDLRRTLEARTGLT